MASRTIPILDINAEVEALWGDLIPAIEGVLKSGQFIMGPNVSAFEDEIAAYLGARHAIAVNSGTDALVISLKALGLGPGDQVITSPFTFFATAEAISQVGAEPVFVDINPLTLNIDPALAEQAVTSRTRAILPVHLYGQAADMGALLPLARVRGLKVIEDVAQACGGAFWGQKLGTLGDAGAFSFFPTKNLGAYGDGGLIVTHDDAVADTARMLRVHGARRKYYNEVVGYNSRLDELQAAILRVKLAHLDRFNEGRRQVAERYRTLLEGHPDLILPAEAPFTTHVYHQYTVRVQGGKRDRVRQRLAGAGVATMIYYPVPLHQLPVYAHCSAVCPRAEAAAAEVLSLPIWPQMEAEVQEQVCQALTEALA